MVQFKGEGLMFYNITLRNLDDTIVDSFPVRIPRAIFEDLPSFTSLNLTVTPVLFRNNREFMGQSGSYSFWLLDDGMYVFGKSLTCLEEATFVIIVI